MSEPAPTENDTVELSHVGYLENLEFSQVVSPEKWSGLTLVLKLRFSFEADSQCSHLEFYQVQGLRLNLPNMLCSFFVEIRSIAEMQLEDQHYHVVESDHGAFSFYCHSFVAVSDGKQPQDATP
ncbi:hypothetical protein [Tuwongella immobilis]|uniref:Uncharacterized protein n=1 Tax=Tuwongella immobilis TaxID=692036 RepID=A0A6C2YH92_9BACT|nr:hypothetical protein [Tuwongella immobilis]VIP00777.1 unnamed protein product [Tuwongella immobilis]VTR96972.1 unnamed protein product [Tuwongella immobilis]